MFRLDLKRKLGQSIYNYLNEKISGLPEYKFNINDIQNSGLVFVNNQNNSAKYYFCENFRISYEIYYFANKSSQIDQLNNFDLILKYLLEMKNLNIDNENYSIEIVYINGKPFQPGNWTAIDLDGFDSNFQIYNLNLEIVGKKIN